MFDAMLPQWDRENAE